MEAQFVRIPLLFDRTSGRREVVLAEPAAEAGTFIVRSIPAFTYGVALHDRIRLLDPDSGAYEVVERGMQVVLRLYVDGDLSRPAIQHLIDAVVAAGGVFEIGKNAERENGKSLLLMAFSAQ